MRPVPLILVASALGLAACSNLANRRALYEPQPVDGPYTRMIQSGSWKFDRSPATNLSGLETGGGGDGKSVVEFQ